MTASASAQPTGDVVARVDFQYRWRTWALFLLLFGYGIWSLRDGFIAWPRDNAVWAKLDPRIDRPLKPPHEASGVLFNQILGVLLTVVSIPIFAWRIHSSRGEYRMSGDTLHVPGHPPLSIGQIRSLDLVLWDRKGIAEVHYELADGVHRTLMLRDMIYERRPTDRIVKRIENFLESQDDAAGEAAEPPV